MFFTLAKILAASLQGLRPLQLLVDHGADVDRKNPFGHAKDFTPLYAATQEGLLENASFLISNNANVNLKGPKGTTALTFAAEHGQVEITELLLSKGADINTQSNKGITPLMIAVSKGNLEIVTLLANSNADINLKSESGFTALNVANDLGETKMIQFLKSKGAVANTSKVSPIKVMVLTGLCIIAVSVLAIRQITKI